VAGRPDGDAGSGHEAAFAANRSLWDAWTAIHVDGEFYDLDGFRAGGVRLRPYEIEMVGGVAGKSLLHLQCHFGIDTLSWARLGARVTGADLSPAAVEAARALAAELGFGDARFIESNLYDLPDVLDGTFDVVYTSRGVLGWLPDIRAWARVVARFVAPCGRFFITEAHPVFSVFENEGVAPGELRLRYPYWEHHDPLIFPVHGSYADPDAEVGEETEHSWDHGLGEIVTALVDAGLRIDALVEHPFLAWAADFLVEEPPGSGEWRLPAEVPGELPLMFTLLASRPE
jgi:SAM-dependent methyltransferase